MPRIVILDDKKKKVRWTERHEAQSGADTTFIPRAAWDVGVNIDYLRANQARSR